MQSSSQNVLPTAPIRRQGPSRSGRAGNTLVRLALVLLFLFPVSVGLAQDTSRDFPLDLSIRLANTRFDPLVAVPASDPALAYNAADALQAGTYILQFEGPVMDEWKHAVAAAGAILGDYIPNYAFLARIEPQTLSRIRALPFVRWVGVFEPAYKLPSGLDATERRTYRITLAPWAVAAAAQQELTAQDASTQVLNRVVLAELQGADIQAAARQDDVVWIEPYPLRKLHNSIGGGTIMGGATSWANGYTGAGVHVAAADTGLDTGDKNAIHQDFTGRIYNISSWPVVAADYGGGCYTANAGANDGASDRDTGHGTHVSGSIAGNGARSSGTIKGLAYQATLSFQAIEQYTTWGSTCAYYPSGYYLTALPLDLRDLLNEAYTWGVRVHNNSWGGGVFGAYDLDAQAFDDFIFGHQDLLVTVAAGNSGRDYDQNGYVDENSIGSPATAKNVLTVGAADNERPTFNYTWYMFLSNVVYNANPTRGDYVSDSRQELAAFSGRGPMADGRIKPDVVAPGTYILSTKSSQTYKTGWAGYDNYYTYMGGTSMSSPLAAGAAALVRQYYTTTEGHTNPSAALIKATLINTAVDISGYGNTSYEAGKPIPNNHEGWGRIDVGAATTTGRQFVDETPGISTGTTRTYYYTATGSKPFKLSLAWSDAAGAPYASPALVNNLNLKVTAPNGTTVYWGNRFSNGWSITGGSTDAINNVENVYVQNPAAGVWRVDVIGQNVPQGPQPFALVVDGVAAPLLAPANLDATVIPGTQIDLSWADNSSNETSFRIERSVNNASWTEIASTPANHTTYSDTGLFCGSNYRYRVRAYNTFGYSAYTNIADVNLPECAPAGPLNLLAVAFPDMQITLFWTDNSYNENGFKLERSQNGVDWEEIVSTGADVNTYTDAGVVSGTLYYYRVLSFNEVGDSAYSNIASKTTGTDLFLFLPLTSN